jgi:Fe2+ transport system protein FeoA
MLTRLSDMKPMQRGTIRSVERPEAVQALIEMGCCLGEGVKVAHVTPAQGPMAIFSGGRKIALRKEAAESLWIELAE